jgi:hypothetical protein
MADTIVPDEKALLASHETLEELRKMQDEIINMDWAEMGSESKDSESILFQKFGVMVSVPSTTNACDDADRFDSLIHIKSRHICSIHIWRD